MFKTECPQCKKEYENYEDRNFISGHGMCVDCYEDRNTPNNGFNQPTTNNLECEHEWKIISTWGVGTLFERRECKKCKRREERHITDDDWSESARLELSSTNNLEGWEEEFNRRFVYEEDVVSYHSSGGSGTIKRLKQDHFGMIKFITELRKHDMEELIKMFSFTHDSFASEREELIKDYYNK